MIDLDRGEKACPLDTEPDAVLQLIAHAEVTATNVVHTSVRTLCVEASLVTHAINCKPLTPGIPTVAGI